MSTPRIARSAPVHTIVLIHGLWMTALSWEHWIRHYSAKGYRVIARSWPGMDEELEALRRDPSAITRLGMAEVVAHYERIIEELEEEPIIVGHSFGALVAQILLDRGHGVAGVAIAPAPAKGIFLLPLSTIRVSLPALRNPANRHRAVGLTPAQFRYAFTHTLTAAESSRVYDRYAVPGPGRVLFQAAFANFHLRAATTVDFRNGERAPLLLVAGEKDHVAPPSLVRTTLDRYRDSDAITDFAEFPDRSHFILGQNSWQEVADYTLDWARRAIENGVRDRRRSAA